jgi:hypothetical protein
MLMNKTFDVLNGRCSARGISNNVNGNDSNKRNIKEIKWAILNAALDLLEKTEKEQQSRKKHSSTPTEIFCSATTWH